MQWYLTWAVASILVRTTQALQQKATAAAQLARLKARSETTCDRLQSDILAIRQQKVGVNLQMPRTFCVQLFIIIVKLCVAGAHRNDLQQHHGMQMKWWQGNDGKDRRPGPSCLTRYCMRCRRCS